MKLDRDPAIIRMAYELKVDLAEGAVRGIIRFCRDKIRSWIRETGNGPVNADGIEGIVRRKLGLVVEEVWTDSDLDALIAKYVRLGEPVFATLRVELDALTFAALLERHSGSTPADRYVAVVDCRGQKGHRRFFSKWHEIAHLLTMTRQIELPFFRCRSDESATERLMDAIAGELGFPDEVIKPKLEEERQETGRLTFAGVERVRQATCPEASFQSMLNACVVRWPNPILLVEAGMGVKKAERDAIESAQLAFVQRAAPEPVLRVLVAIANEAARRSRFRVDKNMAVPGESVVHRIFAGVEPSTPSSGEFEAIEDLALWRHSDGASVGSGPVRIHAKHVGPRVVALLQR